MIRPRWLAHLWAWLWGYFWIPCPVCREPFAGFEAGRGWHGVNHQVIDGMRECQVTCAKPGCMDEAIRQTNAFYEKLHRERTDKVIGFRPGSGFTS